MDQFHPFSKPDNAAIMLHSTALSAAHSTENILIFIIIFCSFN